MALLPELWDELDVLARELKADVTAESVEKFKTVLNRAIPSVDVQDEIRYEEFRMIFALDRKGIINSLLHSHDIHVKSRILWTSANHIVRAFGLNSILFIEWQHRGNYQVSARQKINGIEDPQSQGYTFNYRFEEDDHPWQQSSSSSDTGHLGHSNTNRQESSEGEGFLDNGFVQVGAKKKNKQKAKNFPSLSKSTNSMNAKKGYSHPPKHQPPNTPNTPNTPKTPKTPKVSKTLKTFKKSTDCGQSNKKISNESNESNFGNSDEEDFKSKHDTKKSNDRKLAQSMPTEPSVSVNPFEFFKGKPMTFGGSWADVDDDDFM